MTDDPPSPAGDDRVAAPQSKGGIWVALQLLAGIAVLVAALFGPRPRHAVGTRRLGAFVLAGTGIATVIAARRALGPAFSVFPRPVPGAPLVRNGPYAHVRHPMYTGVLAQAAAVALAGSAWALAPACALAAILDRKAAREERALAAAHPAAPPGPRWRFMPGVR